MMIYRVLLLLTFFTLPRLLAGQSTIGLREILNYEKQRYNAGAQNWDIGQDVQGRVYFANNEGLLSFDGTYWKLYPLPNKTIVRSIEFGKDNRVYVGGQDEIGYFSPDRTGRLVYTSLKELLPEPDRRFADLWNIASYGDDIFFRSESKIFRYSKNAMTVYRPLSGWLFLGLCNGRLIAQGRQEGLMVYDNDKWAPMTLKGPVPAGMFITSAISFGKDSTLVTTQKDGLFILTGDHLDRFAIRGPGVDPYQNFSCAVRIDEKEVIVGTYTNGFYLINKKGEVIENLSKREGLQNSNIRSLFRDRNGNIWLGLDSGIDFIAFNNAIKHINPSILNAGSGYAAIIHNNSLFLGLSNGIYELPLPDIPDLSYARSNWKYITDGQVWGLSLVNDKLLAGRDEGFFEIRDGQAIPVIRGSGFWTYQPMKNIHSSSLVVAGNYHGVRLFESKGDIFVDKGNIGGFSESARFVAVDNNNIIWVSHPYRGVYKLQLDSVARLYTDKDGLPSSLNNHVYKVKNRIVIATEKGVYEYNSHTDHFEASAYYKDIFGQASVRYLKEDPNGNIWFIQEKNIGVVDFSTLKPSIIYLPELKGKMVSGFEHVFPLNDNNIFVGGEKGFYHINFEKYKQNNNPLSVYIRTVKAIGKVDSLLFGGYFGNVNENAQQAKEQSPSVSHQWNSFHIEYSSPLFEQQSNIEYSYNLEGFDKSWSEWSKKPEKDYTNLPAGNYTFQVKARNNLGNESTASLYSFRVMPPWHQTTWAYIIYCLAAVYLAWYLYRKQQQRLLSERQKHQEEQRRSAYLHQLELEKAEKEVVKLKNEKLETEIEFKNSELASTAMHLVHKEEFLAKVKGELQHLDKTAKDKADPAELKKILRILSEEEKLNQEWEQFSVHFNKVHSDLLIILKEKYPSLKAHELKLCAYLRMNLSTKEIARLMSISVRGVEVSRYRVRKKLQIPTEVNLFQFLFDFQRENLKS